MRVVKYSSSLMGYVKNLSLQTANEIDLLFNTDLSDKEEENLCDFLNSINNQQIEHVYLNNGIYVQSGRRLPLCCLSRAERMFLLGYLADKANKIIYFGQCFLQLTPKSLRTFLCKFANSEFVNFSYNSLDDFCYLNRNIAQLDSGYQSKIQIVKEGEFND